MGVYSFVPYICNRGTEQMYSKIPVWGFLYRVDIC